MNNFYNNTSYQNNINTKKVFTLDIDDSYEKDNELHILGSSEIFNIKFAEPLRIDKKSELFLDNLVTYNCNITNDNDNIAFIVDIREFNIESSIASNSSLVNPSNTPITTNGNIMMNNKIIIPNENDNISNYYTSIIHKSKKLNYICDIVPGVYNSLSGKITNLNGDPIYHGQQKGNNYTYSLSNILWRNNGTHGSFTNGTSPQYFTSGQNASLSNIEKNTEFILWSSKNNKKIACTLLNHLTIYANTIHFSTNATHTDMINNIHNASNVNMLLSTVPISTVNCDLGGSPSVENELVVTSTINMNLYLENISGSIKTYGFPELQYGNGRFTAEFAIIEK